MAGKKKHNYLLQMLLSLDPDGDHKHRCPECGFIWKHANDTSSKCSSRQFERAHTCPQCKTGGATMKYFGPLPAEREYPRRRAA